VHRIIRGLPSGQMAAGISAIGWSNRQIIIVVDVARCAGHVGVPIGQQESRRGVIKDCRSPSRGVVARGALRRCERWPGSGMYGIGGRLPSAQMASGISAVRRRDR
jgi:hypothetical protein